MPTTASVQLLSEASLPRSSHSLALIHNVLYILGGEVQPREPASPFLHTFNLNDGSLNSLEIEPSPAPRVGAASVVVDGKIYLWGGRGGKSMSALNEGGKFWVFNPNMSSWSQTSAANGDIPEPRSYHSLAAIDAIPAYPLDKIYLHAGCPATGRLSSLHVYSISENKWAQCAPGPGSPRGGTSLVAIGSVPLRFGGFNGEELGDVVDVFNPPTNSWSSRPLSHGPGKRSVATFLPHPSYPTTKAVLIFGEKSPSSDGHNAAGTFWKDIWIYHYVNDQWEQVDLENKHVLNNEGLGWGAGAVDREDDTQKILIWGGLNEHNKRIRSGWSIRLSA